MSKIHHVTQRYRTIGTPLCTVITTRPWAPDCGTNIMGTPNPQLTTEWGRVTCKKCLRYKEAPCSS